MLSGSEASGVTNCWVWSTRMLRGAQHDTSRGVFYGVL